MKYLVYLLLAGCGAMAPGGDTYNSEVTWKCLGSPAAVPTAAGDRVTYAVPVVDFDSQLYAPTTVPGAQLLVCTSAACDVPFTDWQGGPGANGLPFLWALSFPAGASNITLRFTAPGYVPMDYALGGPMVQDAEGVGIPLVKETTLASLQAQVGLGAVDPHRGTYAARVLDCGNTRASDVNITATPVTADAVMFSLSNDNLATRATLETDERGVAGFFNLLPGTMDVTGLVGGKQVAEPVTVNVRPGVITLTEVRPSLGVWGQ